MGCMQSGLPYGNLVTFFLTGRGGMSTLSSILMMVVAFADIIRDPDSMQCEAL